MKGRNVDIDYDKAEKLISQEWQKIKNNAIEVLWDESTTIPEEHEKDFHMIGGQWKGLEEFGKAVKEWMEMAEPAFKKKKKKSDAHKNFANLVITIKQGSKASADTQRRNLENVQKASAAHIDTTVKQTEEFIGDLVETVENLLPGVHVHKNDLKIVEFRGIKMLNYEKKAILETLYAMSGQSHGHIQSGLNHTVCPSNPSFLLKIHLKNIKPWVQKKVSWSIGAG